MRAVAALDERDDGNPIAADVRAARARLVASGLDSALAERVAATRIFGSKPGAYGAGLQALIDEGGWETRRRSRARLSRLGRLRLWRRQPGRRRARELLAEAAEGRRGGAPQPGQPRARHPRFRRLLPVRGRARRDGRDAEGLAPPVYHNDHSRPEKPGRPLARARRSPGSCAAARSTRNGSPASCATATRAPSRWPRRSTTSSPSPPPTRRRRATTISTCSTTPISPTTTVRDFIAEANPPALARDRGPLPRGDRARPLVAALEQRL